MENEPYNPNQEKTYIVELLRNKPFSDIEVQAALHLWLDKKEAYVQRIGTPEAMLDFDIERAELYFRGGYIAEAIANLEKTLLAAGHEGLEKYVERIEQRLKEYYNAI